MVNPDLTVKKAGGYIIQLLPGCPDEIIDIIEKNVSEIPSVTTMLDEGMTPDEIAIKAMQGIELDKLDENTAEYRCNCSRKKVENALISTGIEALTEMANDDKDTKVECHFCNKEYVFTPQDIKQIINASTKK